MNIVKAIFSGGCTQITAAEALWQWDQGQILQIVGLDLPDAYQVEFSNQPVRGAAAPMIGGVGGVEIPDVYLTTGRDIYAFVVLHSGETDRETEYRITIHVNARPQPTDVQPTPEQQGVIDQLIAALNAGVDRAEDAADEAEGSAGDAAAQAQAAAQSAISSASSASDAAAQAGLAATAKAGAEAAQAAAETAQGSAEAFAAAAGAAKAAAETAQGKAEDAQTAAEAAQAAAESAKAGALAAKAAAETAQGKAEDAQESAEQAAQDAHVEYEQLAGQVTAQGQTIAQHGQAIAQNTEDIADLDTELTRQKSAIEDLTDLTNRKAGMLVDTASGAIASFVPDATIPDLLGLTVDIEPVQAGSGDPSPDNVRPISGWDGVEVSNTSTNIWDEQWEVGGYASANGQPWNTTDRIRSKADNYISVLPNTAYYFKTPQNTNVCFYDANKAYIGTRTFINEAFTTPANAYYMRFACQPIYGTTYNHDISINYPSTDHAYHPYAGSTYTIPLGNTVYGGTLDVTNGTLTVNRAMVDLGTLAWYKNTYAGVTMMVCPISSKARTGGDPIPAICSIYEASDDIWSSSTLRDKIFSINYAGQYLYVYDSDYTDAATFKAAVSGQQICYELATPTPISTTPTEISTVDGENNVFSPDGDVTVEYAADLKTYIDNKIAAAVAALS